MPTMPNVVGLTLPNAEATLKKAGVLDPLSIGYFGTGAIQTLTGTAVAGAAARWPITVNWVNQEASSGTVDGLIAPTPRPGLVLTQSPAPGATIAANAPVTLSAVQPAMSISYPGTNLTNGFN